MPNKRWEKIQKLVEARGESLPWLAVQLGIKKQSIYQWREGTKSRDREIYKKIAKILEVDVEVLNNDEMGLPHKNAQSPYVPVTAMETGKIKIVGTGSAGPGIENQYDIQEELDVPIQLCQPDYSGLIISGDSMFPLLFPGDTAVFQDCKDPKLNHVFAVRADPNDPSDVLVKQLRHNGREFYLHSLNASYEEVSLKEMELLGYLVGISRWDGEEWTVRYRRAGIKP